MNFNDCRAALCARQVQGSRCAIFTAAPWRSVSVPCSHRDPTYYVPFQVECRRLRPNGLVANQLRPILSLSMQALGHYQAAALPPAWYQPLLAADAIAASDKSAYLAGSSKKAGQGSQTD